MSKRIYKIKYVIIAEDENGNFLEQVSEEYIDSAQEAHEYILDYLDFESDYES